MTTLSPEYDARCDMPLCKRAYPSAMLFVIPMVGRICKTCFRDLTRASRDAARRADLDARRSLINDRIDDRARRERVRAAGSGDPLKLAGYAAKEAHARAAHSGDTGALNALAREAAARGVSAHDLASAILDNATDLRGALLAIDARASELKAAVARATSIEVLEALDIAGGWPT